MRSSKIIIINDLRKPALELSTVPSGAQFALVGGAGCLCGKNDPPTGTVSSRPCGIESAAGSHVHHHLMATSGKRSSKEDSRPREQK
jgi:hypothetical protein